MIQSIIHIALVVKDYDEAIEFYTNKLHFTLIYHLKTKYTQKSCYLYKSELHFQTSLIFGGTVQKLATFLGDKAKEETKSMAIAAGATVAGLVVLGPVGIVTGAFIKGEDVKVPEGALMYIQTKAENTVYAIVVHQ